MFLFAGLVPLVLLATGFVTEPSFAQHSLIKVPLSKRTTGFNGMSNLAKRDRKQLRNLGKRGCTRRQSPTASKIADIPLNNTGGIYVATIGFGDPSREYRLLLDSGSALTWVGANHPYVPSKSSVKTKDTVDITYSNGFFKGTTYNDTVTIAENITVSQQSIGVASNSSGFSPLDGVLAIGPTDLTFGILHPDNNAITRTVTDNLFLQGKIQNNLVAVSFEPTNSFPKVNGELTFGGIDHTKHIGQLNYFPPASSPSANVYWSVDAAVRYGNRTILNRASGIFDTGTTLLGLATDAYSQYVKETGAMLDETTGLLMISFDQYEKLQPLYFNIGNITYKFNRNAQIWPRALNHLLGGEKDMVYLIVNDLGPGLSQEMGLVAGMTFLERFYIVFDSSQNRVGLANTRFTDWMTIN